MHLAVAAHDFYPDPGSGGTGRYVYETTKRLADRGHDVSVLTRRRGDVPTRETIEGVRVARYDLSVADESAPTIAAQLPEATRTLRSHLDALTDPDLVSFQGTVTDPLLDLLADDDIPRSATFHSPWPTEYRIRTGHGGDESDVSLARRELNARIRARIERETLADCEQVFALSRFMAQKLRSVHGPVADPEVVPGGVDTERYRSDAGVYDPISSEDSGIDFLTVRRLSPRMGHEMLLRAFARVVSESERESNPHLFVAGDGPLREGLEREAAELGISDRVTFLGYVPDEDLPSAYATADCFVLPTRKLEGFGLATLEALASETPVVATPVGGTTEILSGLTDTDRVADPMPADLVVESADAASLADQMTAWAALEPGEREAAGRACRQYVREKYRWDQTADALEERYEKLV